MRLQNLPGKKTIFLSFFLLFFGLTCYAQSKSLVVIGDDYPNKESILASVPKSVKILQIDQNDNLWNEVYSVIIEDVQVIDVHFFLKTTDNEIEIGTNKMGIEELENSSDLQNLSAIVVSNRNPNLFVYSCSLASNPLGLNLLEIIGEKTLFNVLSSANCSSIFDSNFHFDYSSKNLIADTNLILD